MGGKVSGAGDGARRETFDGSSRVPDDDIVFWCPQCGSYPARPSDCRPDPDRPGVLHLDEHHCTTALETTVEKHVFDRAQIAYLELS